MIDYERMLDLFENTAYSIKEVLVRKSEYNAKRAKAYQEVLDRRSI